MASWTIFDARKARNRSAVRFSSSCHVRHWGWLKKGIPVRKKPQESGDAVQAVERACRLLRALPESGEAARLRDIVERTGLHKATASRLLRTLEREGLIERVGRYQLRSLVRMASRRGQRIGFATRGVDTPFSRTVTESVQQAAEAAGLELTTVSSHRSPRAALRNVETLVREAVKLVIEFQSHERLAPVISSRFLEAGIPVIAIEIPHPGATYFGANNYQAGLLGGRELGRWIQANWKGRLEQVMLLEEDVAGPLVRLRVEGMLAGLRETLRSAERAVTLEIDAKGSMEGAFDAVRRHLRLSPSRLTGVLAGNDPMALGAIRAFEEAGRARHCSVMGQNATVEARTELRRPASPLVGSVAYFPERYGEEVIRLAKTILAGKPVPSAVFTKHELITPANVDRVYPLDRPAHRLGS
jgi:ribose transport system substrate-binding protein